MPYQRELLMMESLWARRSKTPESSSENRQRRSGGAQKERAGQSLKASADPTACVQAMLASRNLLVAIKDLDGRYLEVNEAYAGALGLDPLAVRGRLDRDLLAPDVAGEMAQRERLAMRGVALKPGLEAFAADAPVYLVERLPILDSRGALVAVCLVAMASPVEVGEAGVVEKMPAMEAEAQSGPIPGSPPLPEACATEPPPPGGWLKVSSASNQVEWDAALYRSLLSLFCQRYADFGVRLAGRLASGEIGDLAKELGRLASGARNLGAIPLAGLASELVAMVERGEVGTLAERLGQFRRALDATILVIECRIRSTAEPFEWPATGEAASENEATGSATLERVRAVA
jgi:hypothetical protein